MKLKRETIQKIPKRKLSLLSKLNFSKRKMLFLILKVHYLNLLSIKSNFQGNKVKHQHLVKAQLQKLYLKWQMKDQLLQNQNSTQVKLVILLSLVNRIHNQQILKSRKYFSIQILEVLKRDQRFKLTSIYHSIIHSTLRIIIKTLPL